MIDLQISTTFELTKSIYGISYYGIIQIVGGQFHGIFFNVLCM